ncbi:MAG TPA: hypothetical protein PLB16_08785 [bacterium]|nr:hypothetical protein [bacterium]
MKKNFMLKEKCVYEGWELEDIKLIEEMFNDENLDLYQELKYPQFYKDFVETSQKLLEIVETKFNPSIKETILKMSLVHAFTAMETFFFNALIVILRHCPEHINEILSHLSISRKHANANNYHLTKIIIEKIAKKSTQNPEKISKIYAILGVQTENNVELSDYMKIRNDIVHRNGRNESGKRIKFSRRKLVNCLKEMRFFVDHAEREIRKLNKKVMI